MAREVCTRHSIDVLVRHSIGGKNEPHVLGTAETCLKPGGLEQLGLFGSLLVVSRGWSREGSLKGGRRSGSFEKLGFCWKEGTTEELRKARNAVRFISGRNGL